MSPDPAAVDALTLHSMPSGAGVDRDAAERAVRDLLVALGQDPDEPRLADTPRRIADSWRDFFERGELRINPLPATGRVGDIVIVREIDFVSVCEHHLLPFSGVAHVAYEPGDHILGLSDIPRIVRYTSSRLCLQEDLTRDIAETVQDVIGAHGVYVQLDARHGCVSDRGVRQSRVSATTTCAVGSLNTPAQRASFIAQFSPTS